MNISANSLFHFTPKRENLLSILKNGFYPRYCIENVRLSFEDKFQQFAEIAIPMVCFCDLRLSQIKYHVEKFGPYAIGLNIDWGIKYGLNPLMYVAPESNPIKIFRDSLSDSLRYLLREHNGNSSEAERLYQIGDHIMYLIRYLKPYSGKMWDGQGFNGKEIKFYDEREWRYIPDYYEMKKCSVKPYLNKGEYMNDVQKQECSRQLVERFRLGFALEDIRYIIVEKEDEIQEMIDDIGKIKRDKPDREQKRLLTKLISIESLQQDF
jgi:Protein of unknown function (DUF2743).